MSLHDKMPCATCGHARHQHATIDTKGGKWPVRCRRCACAAYVAPPIPARRKQEPS